MRDKRDKRIFELLSLLEKEGTSAFNELSYLEIIRPLVWRDWLGNGGKLGYNGLSRRYSITYQNARTLVKQSKKNRLESKTC